MNRIIAILIGTLAFSAYLNAGEFTPIREKGISVHALPKRVAKLSGKPWGFQVSFAPYLKPEPGQPFLQTIDEVIQFINKQESSVIANGFWVVTTHPSAYDQEEAELHNKVIETLPKNNIPLFWVRGSELENGFKRY